MKPITMTKNDIGKLANKIYEMLKVHELADCIRIYYNNECISSDSNQKMTIIKNISPADYFEYINYDHIISISFEGNLYDYLDFYGGFPNDLEELFTKYHIYHELGNYWNCSFYPTDEGHVIWETTNYKKPPKPTYIYMNKKGNPEKLNDILYAWHYMCKMHGDAGPCVIGAYFSFYYKDVYYQMAPSSPYQGCDSWNPYVDVIKKLLEQAGCTDISWNCGILD